MFGRRRSTRARANCRRSSRARSSTRRCGRGRCRSTSGSAASRPARRSSRSPADLAGDHRSAAVARKVALGALGPSPVLLVLDLGRPSRFVNMLRIFKPRSPMSMGAWALTLFGNLAAAAVGADLLGRRRLARSLGAANALVGGYLGSYTGVLLASTAVPVWGRSRLFLGPIFVSTAAATGAAACRLALVADGLPVGHPDAARAGNRRDGRDDRRARALDRQRAAVGRARLRAQRPAAPASSSRSPSGRSASGLGCGSRASAAAPGCTTSPACSISRPAWPSATPGSARAATRHSTTRSWRRWRARAGAEPRRPGPAGPWRPGRRRAARRARRSSGRTRRGGRRARSRRRGRR